MDKKKISRRRLFTAAKNVITTPSPSSTGVYIPNKADSKIEIQSPLIDTNGYTPVAQFYRQHLQAIPQIISVYWALRIYGLVEKPQTLTYSDLSTLPQTQLDCTLSCIGGSVQNPMIGHALWTGVPLTTLLEQVRPLSMGRYAQFYSTDGYTTYLETEKLSDAVLAYAMNGEPLSPEHGYPARLIVPGHYGYKMPKWIQRIEFTDTPQPGFWEKRGWSVEGEVQITSSILSPYHQQAVQGNVQIGGIAYAGKNPVDKVEISINDAPWMPVPIAKSKPYTWTRWQIDWMPPHTGDYLIKVRASSDPGGTQSDRTPTFPNGPTAIQSIIVRVTE